MNQMQNAYRQQVPKGWRGRWMRRFGMDMATTPMMRGELTIPNWFAEKSMVFFFVAMFTCFIAFGYPMEFRDAFIAGLSVVLFFYGGMSMSKSWGRKKEKVFLKYIFLVGLIIRLIWMLYCYLVFNMEYHGNLYGDNTDTLWYVTFAQNMTPWLSGDSTNTLSEIISQNGSAIDDVGYPMWLAILYSIFGIENEVFVPYILKCIFSAYCSVCVFHIAKRHFGDGVARMAAIFVCLNPNMIYWCGNMFKESEMVFLTCLCVDLVDKTLTSGNKLTFRSLLPGLLAGSLLFFFRASLAIVIFLAIGSHIVMVSQRVMSTGKKVLAGLMVVATLMIGIGDSLRSQAESLVERAQSDSQKTNMEWRSTRKDGGNSFAKYAGTAVFAPLIFTIPFPSFNVALESQVLQRQLSGGSYIKNILSFFVIMVMLMMLISGEWRRHVFIIAYTCGYVASLALSEFAQSGRFHMPAIPMLMLFAAYGIQIAKTNAKLKRWFSIVLVLEVFVCLAWNWFKLKGRGMI